jgi:hypothetical protein
LQRLYIQDQAAKEYLRDPAAKHQAALQQLTIREAHGGWILTRRGWPSAYSELVFTDREKLIAAISEHFPERSKG